MKRFWRVYLDTSVFGGCFDPQFRDESCRVIEAVRKGRIVAIVSPLVIDELAPAPEAVRDLVTGLEQSMVERIDLTRDMRELAEAYIGSGVVSPNWRDDALHVAAATVARADAIFSWNFRHIVRLDRIKGFNAVNLQNGYGVLTILSPREYADDDEPS